MHTAKSTRPRGHLAFTPFTRFTQGLAVAGLACVVSLASPPPLAAAATPWPANVPVGQDHPLIQRFRGAVLLGFQFQAWGQAEVPLGAQSVRDGSGRHLKDVQTVEGRITRLVYLTPQGKSPLEVFRNHVQALTAAGLTRQYSCEAHCEDLFFGWTGSGDMARLAQTLRWTSGGIPSATSPTTAYNVVDPLTPDEGRMLVGTVPNGQGGAPVSVLVYTSAAVNGDTQAAATYIQIVEPKAMQTGQVTVNAKALADGLQSKGRVALYGLYFDTGKAVIRPESNGQLAEMAKLLKAQPGLKVYIVGHTDNQGASQVNEGLSRQRAQAVVNALVSSYQIDPVRLQARGVGSLAPVATNASEDGRAQNRRVEMVLQ